jgi:hypothetical protein
MERRDILKLAAAMTGSAMLSPLTSSMLYASVGKKAGLKATSSPAFFNAGVFNALSQIMDVILPRTDSPSATDVNVPGIMDNMFNKVFKPGYRSAFLKRFAVLREYLSKESFFESDPNKQLSIIKAIEAKSNSEQDAVYRFKTTDYFLLSSDRRGCRETLKLSSNPGSVRCADKR